MQPVGLKNIQLASLAAEILIKRTVMMKKIWFGGSAIVCVELIL